MLANVGGKPHSLTADDGTFDTGIVNPGAQGGRFAGANASIVPGKAGTFPFHCEVHPEAMKGVLTVTGEAAAGWRRGVQCAEQGGREDHRLRVRSAGGVRRARRHRHVDEHRASAAHGDVRRRRQPRHRTARRPGAKARSSRPAEPGSYSYRCIVHPAKMRGVLVVVGQATGDPTKVDVAGGRGAAAGAGPGGGVSTLALATGVGGAFIGGFALSQFVRNKPSGVGGRAGRRHRTRRPTSRAFDPRPTSTGAATTGFVAPNTSRCLESVAGTPRSSDFGSVCRTRSVQ